VDCSACGLYRLCLPGGLDEAQCRQLERLIVRRRPIKRGECLFRRGDPFRSIFAIRSGALKTWVPVQGGAQRIVGFHFPGELLGLDAISMGRHPHAAEALEGSGVCEVPFEAFEHLAQDLAGLQRQMFRIMSNEIAQAQGRRVPLSRGSTRAQLAMFLLNISARLRQRGFLDTEYHLSMSRTDIANHLGVAVETVCRVFAQFQEDGVLLVHRRFIRLLDLARLRTIAGLASWAGRAPEGPV
jgi:CRP/FNR family transcriptional regulator